MIFVAIVETWYSKTLVLVFQQAFCDTAPARKGGHCLCPARWGEGPISPLGFLWYLGSVGLLVSAEQGWELAPHEASADTTTARNNRGASLLLTHVLYHCRRVDLPLLGGGKSPNCIRSPLTRPRQQGRGRCPGTPTWSPLTLWVGNFLTALWAQKSSFLTQPSLIPVRMRQHEGWLGHLVTAWQR